MDGGVRLKAGEQWSAMRAAGLLGVRMERGKRALSPSTVRCTSYCPSFTDTLRELTLSTLLGRETGKSGGVE